MNGLQGLKDRYWQQTVPPVSQRQKLWKVRGRLHFGHRGGPYKSPWLPGKRKQRLQREIHLERD